MSQSHGLTIYRSNRTEALSAELASLFSTPLADPLVPECVVVQGRGMAVWLGMEIARHQGIWANAELLYPRNFVQRIYRQVLGEKAVASYTRAELMWAVMASLDGPFEDAEMAPLERYLRDDPRGERRYQLAQAVAHAFDQYLSYRPEMILGWEQFQVDDLGDADLWQPRLWRLVAERLGMNHAAAQHRAFLKKMAQAGIDEGLPERVSIFGISSLPPMYVRTIAALARHREVHLFLLSPSSEFWQDACSPKAKAKVLAAGGSPEELYLDDAHPLLASCGRIGAEFLRVLNAECEAVECVVKEPPENLYCEPGRDTVLARLQSDILHLRDSDELEEGAELVRGDQTISIHACHSRMREVEVLRDQLLDVLNGDDGVRPQDIVVMMSDVEAYAPLIEAVFTRDTSDPHHIPFHVADRSISVDSPLVDALDRILSLAGRRITAAEVIELLNVDVIQKRFGIRAKDVEQIARWIDGCGIRWGRDAAHRGEHGQPTRIENTWRFGLDRMLLGYAMPGASRNLFGGVLPFDEIEGQSAQLLGHLISFCTGLFQTLERLQQPRSLGEWRDVVASLLSALLVDDRDTAWQHQRVLLTLAELGEHAEEAGFDGPVHVEVLRQLIAKQLDESHPERGFLSGGVSFCALVPMRSIPFRVVALLGMSDRDFPRRDRPADFDLVGSWGAKRRAGDRSRRDDDRYLFLESLLSARDRLLITYRGQSIKDNSRMPPAVVVSELVDHLVKTYGLDEDRVAGKRDDLTQQFLLCRHPLQPFSTRYFDGHDGNLFSYAEHYLRAATAREEATGAVPLFSQPLPTPFEDNEPRRLLLGDLERFYADPIKYLLQQRLKLSGGADNVALKEREPLELDELSRYQLGTRLLKLKLDSLDDATITSLAVASGELPHGVVGQLDCRALLSKAAPIAAAVSERRKGERLPPTTFSINVSEQVTLTGALTDRWPDGVLRYQYGEVRGDQLLRCWVHHLAFCVVEAGQADQRCRSTLVGRKGERADVYTFGPVVAPMTHLRRLVQLFEIGMCEPLLVFPRASYAYAQGYQQSAEGEDREAAGMKRAATPWARDWQYNEHLHSLLPKDLAELAGEHPGGEDYDGPGFGQLARELFVPLLEHLQEPKG